jgi:hypothetical protein
VSRAALLVLGTGVCVVLGWTVVTIAALRLMAEMRRPCSCGLDHDDPLDVDPVGHASRPRNDPGETPTTTHRRTT